MNKLGYMLCASRHVGMNKIAKSFHAMMGNFEAIVAANVKQIYKVNDHPSVYKSYQSKDVQGIRSSSACVLHGSSVKHALVSAALYEYTSSYSPGPFKLFVRNGHSLDRKWLTRLWLEGNKMGRLKSKSKKSITRSTANEYLLQDGVPSPENAPYVSVVPQGQDQTTREETYIAPPPSQSLEGALQPRSLEEVKIASLLARANLLITRDIEWANLMFSFEQENRYAVVDPTYSHTPVGFIREQSNIFMRQLLRTRRNFIALATDALGNELFRVRRPPWLINSTIYVEIDGKEVGVVHRRWHLWKRIYDLYLRDKQFAYVENAGFWDWTFTLKNENGETLAEIDRDWRGFGFEMFTDAGQYVIRFGDVGTSSNIGPAAQIQQLEVSRLLTLSERAVAVALAISLDNDYFSRHSGWGIPLIPFWASEE